MITTGDLYLFSFAIAISTSTNGSAVCILLEEAISHIVARQRLEKQWLLGNVFQQYCNV
jgi:ABC-type amino acid transport system permease subunit